MTKRGPGRPRIEEERHMIGVPVNVALMPLLRRHRELTGDGMGPTIARILTNHLDELRAEVQRLEDASADREGQQRLELKQSA